MSTIARTYDFASTDASADASSSGRWLPWLVIVVVGGGFYLTDHDPTTSLADSFTQTAEEMEATAAGGDLLRRLVFPGMALFGTMLVATSSWFREGHAPRIDWLLLGPLLLFLLWCGASVLWSHEPGMTLRRLIVLGCLVVAAVGVASRVRPADLMLVGVVVPTVTLTIGILAEMRLGTFRPWAGDYRFSGTLHPNTQGINLACLCFSAAGLMQVHRRWRPLLAALFCYGFLFVILTKSRTSAAGVLVALTAYWTVTTPLRTKLLLGFLGTWCVLALAFVVLLAGVELGEKVGDAALLGREEQAESLTGRVPIWTELSRFVGERPLLGFGYDSFWTPEHIADVSAELHWGIREAHSTFFDAILSVGLVGLGLALATVLIGMWRCHSALAETGDPAFGLLLAMCVFGLINACTESAMLMPSFYTFLLGTGLISTATLKATDDTPARSAKRRNCGSTGHSTRDFGGTSNPVALRSGLVSNDCLAGASDATRTQGPLPVRNPML